MIQHHTSIIIAFHNFPVPRSQYRSPHHHRFPTTIFINHREHNIISPTQQQLYQSNFIMRIKRQAKARKSLEFFVRAFSFEEPFKFLVDPDFLLGLLKSGLNLRLALQNLISVKDKDCKIFLTTCIRRELEALSVTPGPRLGEWKGALAMVDNRDNNIHYVACKHPKTLKCNAHQCIKWSMAPAQLTAELEGKAAAIADESDDEPEVKKKSSGSNFKGNARPINTPPPRVRTLSLG